MKSTKLLQLFKLLPLQIFLVALKLQLGANPPSPRDQQVYPGSSRESVIRIMHPHLPAHAAGACLCVMSVASLAARSSTRTDHEQCRWLQRDQFE